MHILNFLLSSFFLFSSLNVVVFAGGEDPFTPKASLIRYWNKQISNDLPKPWFLLNKASPLTAVQSASFTKLAAQNSLSTQLQSFCSSAKLLCYPDLAPSLEKHTGNVNFKAYEEKNFTSYGTSRLGGVDSFNSYSPDNSAINTFRRYSRSAVGHNEKFSNYAPDTNVPDLNFNTYGTKTTGGAGEFKKYAERVNAPTIRFTSYSEETGGREQKFTFYAESGNGGDQSFTSYGKKGKGALNEFTSYGNYTNVVGSTFSNYGENANGANDSFTSYGENGNVLENNFKNYGENANGANDSFTSYGENGNIPQNNFKNYGAGGIFAVDTFANYRDESNVGDDSFKAYAKSSNGADVEFKNYGKSYNEGTDKFTGYGGGTVDNQKFGFKVYGVNNTFKDYADKKLVSFSSYTKKGSDSATELEEMKMSSKVVNKWVEPGKFFRESMLKTGTVMPMPDIRDKMPKRSFLPRVISSKLPFSTSKLGELKKIFHAGDNSSMEGMLANAMSECERAPSRGESKWCVGSVEDMIDFATSVLGRNVVVRTTENTQGSKGDVILGKVKGINGGKVTKSVSCHQSLFPYLLYYCHSVPKVRVYEADLHDPKTKLKINHGVAICHIDTSAWSATHGAFLELGSGPGKIEVCHWIFENDMTWAVAD